jgi:hypothetical protein
MLFFHILLKALQALFITGASEGLGLLKQVPDERDFSYDKVFLGVASYIPKHQVYEVPVTPIKNQLPFNTCCFASAVSQKEVSEGVELSVKSVVAFAKSKGRLQADGYSTLRNAQQCLIDFGVAESSVLDDSRGDFTSYASFLNLTKEVRESAALHKASKFFSVTTRDAWFKALDEDNAIQTWMTWRTAYNMSGGLKPPYVLPIGKGAAVGGHAFKCVGYDLKKGLMKFQNSFGKAYGDEGYFYIRISDWFNIIKSVGYVSIDADNSQVIASYNGKSVKAENDPKIYRIENGKKRLFPNEQVFYSHGERFGTDKTWVLISGSLLRSIPEGANMKQK